MKKLLIISGKILLGLLALLVENFQGKVLFLTGECKTLIGPEYQEDHMMYFNNAEMVIIKDDTMFGEKPEESINAVRNYFNEE